MKPKRILLFLSVALIAVIAAYFLFFRKKAGDNSLLASVQKSAFEVQVMTTGELRSRTETKIMAPQGLRQLDIYQVKIANLVPEGTIVKQGDFVASLDNSDVMTKLNQQKLELDKQEAQYTQAKLDTMLDLRAARDELVNLRYDLQTSKLEKEQSKYEAPAEIQRIELEYEKAQRTLNQKQDNYKTKKIQALTKMQIIGSDLAQMQNKMKQLTDVLSQFSIKAPKGGMVIYSKNWDGTKKSVGTIIQLWDGGIVATLPDLSEMEAVTYVNEVDVQKVKIGQHVSIGLDAAPGKKLEGVVKSVASIGQQKPNSDAKVFEVLINVLTKDSTLRPAMTTSCQILTENYANALQIPLEAIYNDPRASYVFKADHGRPVKQQIKVLTVNETNALISNGLKEGDQVYLTLPSDTTGLKLVKLNPKEAVTPRQLVTIDTAMVRRLNDEQEMERKDKSGSGGGGGVIVL